MLSDAATIERFKAWASPITVIWLDDNGARCTQAAAGMALLRRSTGAGTVTIRVDAGDVGHYTPELV